ncbi:Aste57867_7174 [Aphanomyces stellatus]|uniref:Aste57867_7174 protein n=1 Tax=Aphanomyces stellatus TaxID=120398 RepID=A0A485KI12_9STRA|nr:hypothetical protein As57867_007149 [Aphanomyces stellatus]VFT84102.1 Aste57867_7174 [Aphanomyces stellatus]
MHRAEKTSSKVCRERELEVAKTIHHKKLGETRSAIDTKKPRTSSMYHMTRNKRRERMAEEREHEIERVNHILVNRMNDVINCSTWEFHPTTSVEDVSYTVYHSPRHSPRKPVAPTKKSLNDGFRTRKLRQIESDNATHKERLRTSRTHYKNTKLVNEWKQSVKYLKSICAFPLLGRTTGPPPENDRFDYPPPARPSLLDDSGLADDNLLEFYSMSLPTINVKEKQLPPHEPTRPPPLPEHQRLDFRSPAKPKPSFQPKRVGMRPGLPSLDPLSPRFKWGPRGFPLADPSLLDADMPYIFKQCRVVDGVYFVLTVTSGHTYGMNVVAYDGETCRSYELAVSKEHVLKILRDCVSIREEFSVEVISRFLCDKLQFIPHVLYIPLEEPVVASPRVVGKATPATITKTSIFCMFHIVPLAPPPTPPYLVSVASSGDGASVHFTAEDPTTHQRYATTKSATDIVAYLKDKSTPKFTTVEAAAVAVLPFLTIEDGRLTWLSGVTPARGSTASVFKSTRWIDGTYYRLNVRALDEPRGSVDIVAYDSEVCESIHVTLTAAQSTDVVVNGNWEVILDHLRVDKGPPRGLRFDSQAVSSKASTTISASSEGTSNESNIAATRPPQPLNVVQAQADDMAETQVEAAKTPQASLRAAQARQREEEQRQAAHVIKTTYLRSIHQKKRAKKRQHNIVLCGGTPPTEGHKSNKTDNVRAEKAAVAIQKIVRGSIARHTVVVEMKRNEHEEQVFRSVTKIQARVRGAQTRQHMETHQHKSVDDANEVAPWRSEAATVIQARIRGSLARKSMHNQHLSTKRETSVEPSRG